MHGCTCVIAQASSESSSLSLKAAPERRQGGRMLSSSRSDSFAIKSGPEPRQPNPMEGRE